MYNIFKIAILFFSTLSISSCEENDNILLMNNSEIISIEYGTSFGEFLGYSNKSVNITSVKIEFNGSGWTNNDKLPDITVSADISLDSWEKLVNKIDFVIFRNLEEVMGCPDCTDGGAEWIEITTNELSHKVIFEYLNEPEEIKPLIEELRVYLNQFNEIQ